MSGTDPRPGAVSSDAAPAPLPPGSTLGVVGGGQLGRYFVLEARRLGYDTRVLDPDPGAPAMQLAAHPLVGAYDDEAALERLGSACDAVTIEFENVPAASLERLASLTRVAPGADAVRVAQDRAREKTRAAELGLEPPVWAPVTDEGDLAGALERVGLPAILKRATLGYDGKGQRVCESEAELGAAFDALGRAPCVLERRVALAAELSVVLARGFDARSVAFPAARNVHRDGILDTSSVPAELPEALTRRATEQARALADGLGYVGVLGVEFFVDEGGALLFNEMAPRPHNSGHYTLDATVCSQFEQQLRALCALPLAEPRLLAPVTMLNLLGESLLGAGPEWTALLADPSLKLHLYGKDEPRRGRKMGHLNCLAANASDARARAEAARRALEGASRASAP